MNTQVPEAAVPAHNSRQHLLGLDGVRGLAILMVMIGHFIVVGKHLDYKVDGQRFFTSGYLGVDLFFVLSGFLITGILIDAKGTPGYFKVFYIRRALRIFPLYYGLLALGWLSVIFITPGDKQVLTGHNLMAWYWLYASNIGMAVKGGWLASPTWLGLGHFWSLAVEEQFYLVWPLIVMLLPVKWLQRLCVALVISSPIIHAILQNQIGLLATYVSTLNRLGVLAAGAWLAIMWRNPDGWKKVTRWLVPVTGFFGIILLIERIFVIYPLASCESFIMIFFGAGCVGLAANGDGAISRFIFESRMLRWLGKYSYGIYVYHHALKPVWMHFFWRGWIVPTIGSGWPGTFTYMACATVASLLLAWLSWKFFESPILSLKSRFTYRSRQR